MRTRVSDSQVARLLDHLTLTETARTLGVSLGMVRGRARKLGIAPKWTPNHGGMRGVLVCACGRLFRDHGLTEWCR